MVETQLCKLRGTSDIYTKYRYDFFSNTLYLYTLYVPQVYLFLRENAINRSLLTAVVVHRTRTSIPGTDRGSCVCMIQLLLRLLQVVLLGCWW